MTSADEPSRYWVHDLDPWLVELWEGGPIRWYGLAYVAGFVVAWLLIRRVLSAGRSPLEPERAGDIVLALALGAVVGGRAGYVLFYQPSLLWSFGAEAPFWGLLAINEGGMSSHGGMLGVLVAALLYARRRGVPALHVLDLAAFAAPLGLFFGRLANFVNGELFGRPTDVSWAVRFPQELYQMGPARLRDVAQAVDPALGGAPLDEANIRARLPEIIDAVQRGQIEVTSALAPHLTPRHPSQLYEAVLEGLLVFLALLVVWRRPQRPGVVVATFAILYAGVRVVVEGFRQPDLHIAHLEYATLSITRGQWLSVALALFGVTLLTFVLRRDAPMLGGYRRH